MVQFASLPFHAYVFSMEYPRGRVVPFGNLRINACLPLPEAYRSLPRPSSAANAKASAIYPYSLDTNSFNPPTNSFNYGRIEVLHFTSRRNLLIILYVLHLQDSCQR